MAASVHFYIGRAGTGKTSCIYAALKENAALFVPEQFTYETERALSRMRGSLMGVRVMSVSRLRERVIASQDKPYLSPQGRRMVVRRAAYLNRKSLSLYKDAARRTGFAKRMEKVISACRQARLTPEYLYEAAASLGEESALALKLMDTALIYSSVSDFLEKHYIDNEGAQDAILSMLPNSSLAGADIYFDGFEAVNEQLYAMLGVLMRVARSVTFTICMDPEPDARDAMIFLPERRVYDRLREMAASLGCTVYEREFNGVPPGKDAALKRLEQDLFAINIRPMAGEIEAIELIGAGERTAEAEALADAVCRAARKGIRYREMAVIASDMNVYAPLVQRAFKERDIPVFLDARRSMQGHPVVELMLSAVKAANSLHCPELIRISKTGLAGVSVDEAEEFENYCLRRGLIGGNVFLEPLNEEYTLAESARSKLMPPLLTLREGLKEGGANTKARAVYAYLEALDIHTQLHDEAERLRNEGRFTLMEEHAQVWGILMEMLEQLHAILGAVEMTTPEFIEVLAEALSAYQVGLIPATADQVLFGDFRRTRSTELRALFVLGCNEGYMPASRADDDFIDDAELNELREAGYAFLEGTAALEQADRLDIYRALSKANEYLWLGFSYADEKNALLPAALIDVIKKLFPGLKEQPADAGLPENEKSGFTRLIRCIGDGERSPLYDYYAAREAYMPRLNRALNFRKAAHTPKLLPKPQAKKIYGDRYFGSVSRLESYRRCPYSYFLEHGLNIKPRREYGQKKTDTGSFSHMALERFLNALMEMDVDFAAVTREQSDKLINDILPACLEEYEQGLLIATARARALTLFVSEAVREAAWAIVMSISAGEFTPFSAELRFGGESGKLPAVELDNGAQLGGVIDRIDVTNSGDYRVIDYKTGDKSLKFGHLYDGIALQLPIYLVAAKGKGAPAGLYYQPVTIPVGNDEMEAKPLRLAGLTCTDAVDKADKGLVGSSEIIKSLARTIKGELNKNANVLTRDEMEALIGFATKRAAEITDELLSGNIEARPVEFSKDVRACTYCAYLSVCRFDKRMPACRVRGLKSMKKEEFIKAIRGDT